MLTSNFQFLSPEETQLFELGVWAERYYHQDPNTSIIKLRQFAEYLAQNIAARAGIVPTETQYELLRQLYSEGVLREEARNLLDHIRRTGNSANHAFGGSKPEAYECLKYAWIVAAWFYCTYVDPNFIPSEFVEPPETPSTEQLTQQLAQIQHDHQALLSRLQELQTQTTRDSKSKAQQANNNTYDFYQYFSERQTRAIIDEQLRAAGWQVDSQNLTYHKGAQPEKGRNLAIAEYPTRNGPADYVLFVGLKPVAVVEAKRKNTGVKGALAQAERYSEGFVYAPEQEQHLHTWQNYRIPFVFSSNSRPYFKPLPTESGIWFRDVRKPNNAAKVLQGWYTPEGLEQLLSSDITQAHQVLQQQSFEYGIGLRHYQKEAIRQVENALQRGDSKMMLAMATGTGKTSTCIALIYRLLRAKRFKRILFLVDRTSLGEQAASAFGSSRMEQSQRFTDIYSLSKLKETTETSTQVDIQTVQGLVKRIFNPSEGVLPPHIDTYDCIVVDECHRGYVLDATQEEGEEHRNSADYLSKYKAVIEYFDAVRIGLTATPALHTVAIFGTPVYTYSYTEAVSDGFLVDHEPPIRIETQLAKEGIVWQKGDSVPAIEQNSGTFETLTLPDELRFDISDFNKKVIATGFNQAVCKELVQHIDLSSKEKTLVFCATDKHADFVVETLSQALRDMHGSIPANTVQKITGKTDRVLEAIRRYRNEEQPKIAVTVDLLTTGVDVPAICNLVFLRRVNSRILYEQMLGRATRRCDEIGKEVFRIFDAVGIYDALSDVNTMKPVIVDIKTTFAQLLSNIEYSTTPEQKKLYQQQLQAKWQRKWRTLSAEDRAYFTEQSQLTPEAFSQQLKTLSPEHVVLWLREAEHLLELLDRSNIRQPNYLYISEHEDRVDSVTRGYGAHTQPQDYLDSFKAHIVKHQDVIPMLDVVLHHPKDLCRKDLKTIAQYFMQQAFTPEFLHIAWQDLTQLDIKTNIVAYIRHAMLNEPIEPYETRVKRARDRVLSSKNNWTAPQRKWLEKIVSQMIANGVVDEDLINEPALVFKREIGGYDRLNSLFEGALPQILADLHHYTWAS